MDIWISASRVQTTHKSEMGIKPFVSKASGTHASFKVKRILCGDSNGFEGSTFYQNSASCIAFTLALPLYLKTSVCQVYARGVEVHLFRVPDVLVTAHHG